MTCHILLRRLIKNKRHGVESDFRSDRSEQLVTEMAQTTTVDAQSAHFLLQLCIMKSSILLISFFFTGLAHAYGASQFRICAFNLHNFGESKAQKSSVMDTLTRVRPAARCPLARVLWPTRLSGTPALPLLCFQIIARCDVTLLQEVRDRKGRALPQLLERLNR